MSHTFTTEQMKSLDSLQPDFHSLIQRLENVVAPDIINQLKNMQGKLTNMMTPYNQEEENRWQENYDALSVIQEENNLDTVWSMEEVSAAQMNDLIPYKINRMEYGMETMIVGGQMTWLHSWKIADSLIKQSGDVDHVFIENFEQLENGCIRIQTGS